MVADFPARGVGDPPGLNPREQILHIAVDHVNTAPPLSGEGLRDERVDERQPRNIFVGAENDVRRAVVAGLEIVINRRVRQARYWFPQKGYALWRQMAVHSIFARVDVG